MSTVAYRDGILAADSQATAGNIACRAEKIFALPNCIVGGAGHLTAVIRFVEWMRAGQSAKKKPDLDGDSLAAIVVWPDGRVEEWDGTLVPMPVFEQFTAVGSGRALAIGAMSMGASAVQAVEVAATWDVHTGGEVIAFDVRNIRPTKRKRR